MLLEKTSEKSALSTYPVSLLASKASSILDRFKDKAVLKEPPRHLKGNQDYSKVKNIFCYDSYYYYYFLFQQIIFFCGFSTKVTCAFPAIKKF